MSIYTEMKEAGLEMDNHESDLYVEDSLKAREILAKYENKSSTFFNCDGKVWIDIPFMYDPFWDAISKKNIVRGIK